MTEWRNMEAFFLLPVLLLVVVYFLWAYRSKVASFKFSTLSILKSSDPGFRAKLKHLPLFLKTLAVLLAIIALARPQKSDTKIKRNIEGIDIVIALDVSDSMLIEDMIPENRLESSKKTIKEFIEKRTSDRIGLVVFSGESYTRVPLTLDYPLLQKSLAEVTTTRNIKMGTAIGVALANSVGRLKESTAKSRVVIFLTDGESNSGTIDPETALEIAKGYGVKIYSIGMGKDGQAQLPYFTALPGGRKVKRYRPMHSKVNEDLLEKMAKETGGQFWRATTSQSLENVFRAIDKLEKTDIEENKYTKYTELFTNYLGWALFLYLLSFLANYTFLRRVP